MQIVALADRGPGYDTSRGDWQTTKLFHVTQGMIADAASAVADWGERNMGDKQTLTDFVSWSKANYPADHYALYFWGHGWSWHPGWVMEDDTNNDTLDYDETKAAIPSLGFIDVVGYDGCNMASLEIMDLWHGHATAITGSQEYVGWDGLEYDVFLNQLKAEPDHDRRPAGHQLQRVDRQRQDVVGGGGRRPDEHAGTAVDQWARRAEERAGREQEGLHQRVRSGPVVLAGADGQGSLRPGGAGQRQGDRRDHPGQGHGRDERVPDRGAARAATSASTRARTASRSTARQPRTRRSTTPTTGPSTSRRTRGGTSS